MKQLKILFWFSCKDARQKSASLCAIVKLYLMLNLILIQTKHLTYKAFILNFSENMHNRHVINQILIDWKWFKSIIVNASDQTNLCLLPSGSECEWHRLVSRRRAECSEWLPARRYETNMKFGSWGIWPLSKIKAIHLSQQVSQGEVGLDNSFYLHTTIYTGTQVGGRQEEHKHFVSLTIKQFPGNDNDMSLIPLPRSHDTRALPGVMADCRQVKSK